MSTDPAPTTTEPTTSTEIPKPGEPAPKPVDKAFSQADVDRIVQDRLSQQAKNKFGDYDALKSKADGAKTLEDRLGSLESELTATKHEALRTSIAARFGVSVDKGKDGQPSDAELFLTGTDEATLTAQAERLAGRTSDQKKHGNVAPKEGTSPANAGDGKEDLRAFAKQLFNKE